MILNKRQKINSYSQLKKNPKNFSEYVIKVERLNENSERASSSPKAVEMFNINWWGYWNVIKRKSTKVKIKNPILMHAQHWIEALQTISQ